MCDRPEAGQQCSHHHRNNSHDDHNDQDDRQGIRLQGLIHCGLPTVGQQELLRYISCIHEPQLQKELQFLLTPAAQTCGAALACCGLRQQQPWYGMVWYGRILWRVAGGRSIQVLVRIGTLSLCRHLRVGMVAQPLEEPHLRIGPWENTAPFPQPYHTIPLSVFESI